MANLVLRPFVPEDYTRLTHEPVCPVSAAPAFTGLLDGEIAGCAGVTLASYGAWGTAWARLGPLGRRHGLAASRAVRRGLATIIRDYGLIRVEADVLAHYDAARRWVTWLGFTEEGLMRKRGPEGADMIRYVLFPKAGA